MAHTNENPYLTGQRLWNERYAIFVNSARTWRNIAIGAFAIAFIAVCGLVYIGSQSKMVPYYVKVDNNGNILSVAGSNEKPENGVLNSQLRDWTIAHRSVVSDPEVQRGYLNKTYTFLRDGSPAKMGIDEWYTTGGNPFERMASGTVTIQVESILNQSANTYQIEWTEIVQDKSGQRHKVFDLAGRELNGERFRALVSIEFAEVDKSTLQLNPLGIIISNISIQKIGG